MYKGKFILERFYTDLELHYSAFDWDDNILHMPTVIHMDKKEGQQWVPVDVSTSEFAVIRNDTLNYRLRDNDPTKAFSEFRDTGPRGKMAFLEDTIEAINSNSLAPAWDHFIETLTKGYIFAIVTARGHEPESIKRSVEYIIDNVLTSDQKYEMYNHCLLHAYLFGERFIDTYDRIPKTPVSKMPLIQRWLSACDFYGVSSDSFKKKFGQATASNPEKAKELALEKFIQKCNRFARIAGAKSVSVGFSDDDPKNVEHVRTFFKERSALASGHGENLKLNLYKTTDRTKKGGVRTRYVGGKEEVYETSHQAWGTEGSVLPFTKWNNMTQRLYPNTKDRPTDDYQNQNKNNIGQLQSLYKEFAYKRKKKK